MSKAIFLPCADGTDRNCYGRVKAEEYSESYFQLTPSQQEEVAEIAEGYTRDDGNLEEEIDGILVIIEPAVCGACGSDYTRDDEGNIID
ncbi:hypothetical protein [Shewanella algae]|uniref:hypothetical protein n=1 Tax=Shewanella algae TaxID=38313 RepID=UPI001AACA782|nr:hypothetical protein [Shewanella algae]QTE88251.1 hypothetical protein JKK44_09160 [Shewanella algae]